MYIDSHAHLSSDELYKEIDAILARAKAAQIETIINICTDKETLERGLLLKEKYPWIYNTGSTTPHDVDKEGALFFDDFAKHARSGNLIAVGETGLDYYYSHSKKETQIAFLRRYLHLAKETNLPVVIHCRDAFSDFFRILDEENYRGKGVLHCFTGTMDEAKEVCDRGFHLSLSGIVTFKKSLELQEVAKFVPEELLLIETDAPYLAPQSHRGKQNEPAYLVETAEYVANQRGVEPAHLAKITTQNVQTLFSL